MKILHIEDRFHPDYGYQLNFFAKYHSPKIEFIILSSKSSFPGNNDSIEELANKDRDFENKYKVKIYRTGQRLDKPNKSNLWLCDLKKTINELNPDIVYVHGIETYTSFRILLNSLSEKYFIVSDTHTLLNQVSNGIKQNIYNAFIKNICAPAINKKRVIVFYTTEENKKILTDIYGINKNNVKPCLIGTDMEQYYYDDTAKRSLRKQLGISEKSNVILYVGKLNYAKNPHLILKALRNIEASINTELNVIFIGYKNEDYYQKEFGELKFNNKRIKVHILNPIASDKLYAYYSMADMAVFPAENTLSALDAQACKLPVIMETDETNDERLKKGGLVYQKNNLKDLGEKIMLLLTDVSLRNKLRIEGFDYITENYNYKKIISYMETFLENALKQRQTKITSKQL